MLNLFDSSQTDQNSPKISVENLNTNLERSPKVFIANQSGHDFSDSERYGIPVYVTKGIINRFSVNYIARRWALSLKDSSKDDYILLTSLTILTVVGAAIFGYLHGCINILLYHNEKYISRKVNFKELFNSIEDSHDE